MWSVDPQGVGVRDRVWGNANIFDGNDDLLNRFAVATGAVQRKSIGLTLVESSTSVPRLLSADSARRSVAASSVDESVSGCLYACSIGIGREENERHPNFRHTCSTTSA